MTTLYIERSTANGTAAICRDGAPAVQTALAGGGAWTASLRELAAGGRIDAIVAGTGPGSFAGIRGAIAFAQGWQAGLADAAGAPRIFGIPSPLGLAAEGKRLAVAGDARRGKIWFAPMDGFSPLRDIFQTDATPEDCRAALEGFGPGRFEIVSPDHRRIGDLLRSAFGGDYSGEAFPCAAGLARAATAVPAVLSPRPLPVYLNPAVRP